MLDALIRRWRALFAARNDISVPTQPAMWRETAYRPSAWFVTGWQLLAANKQSDVEARLVAAEPGQGDLSEHACLCAGLALMRGSLEESQEHLKRALAARANFPHLHIQCARALLVNGQRREALAAFQRATELAPDEPVFWVEQAHAHLALDEGDDALDCYELALAHAPGSVDARLGLARMLRESGDLQAARRHIQEALNIAPHDAEIHFEAALVNRRAGDTNGSIAAYERALDLRPDFVAAHVNLGLMYLSLRGDPSLAQKHFERAIEFDPACIAAQANLGLALEERGNVDEAIAHYEKLIMANPAEDEYRWNRGLALLGSGDYARGWDDYELRHVRGAGPAPRVFPFPVWGGGALRRGASLLVYAEQGLGDEIMFASCVPDLSARGISVVIECDPRLAALFTRSFPGASVRGAARDGDRRWLAEYPQIEQQIAIGSLPRLLRRNTTDFPHHSGYLHADPARVAHWRARLAQGGVGKNIGITWRGGTAGTRRDLRSIPVQDLAPVFKMPGIVFVNLQREADDLLKNSLLPPSSAIINLIEALNDVDEMAAFLQALDGVIAVDNSVAHLAGALGCRARIILSHSADWRWQRGTPVSPWYPSVTLYRQPAPGDWAGAISRLGAEWES